MTSEPGAVRPGASAWAPALITEHPLGLLEAVCSQMSEGLLVVGADRRVRFANERAVELLALPTGWPGAPLTSITTDYRLVLTVTSCFDHSRPVERSLSDGPRGREVLLRALPIGAGDGRAEVAVVLRDESQIRRLETMRRDFTANISHELRTPATAIKLMVDTLRSGALDDRDAAIEFISRIGSEAGYMTRMIEEMLELSAVQSGRRIQSSEPVSVAEVLASADRLRPLADARGVIIEVSALEALPPLMGESPRLGEALRNLVHNAIKFSPPGGVVTVTAAAEPPGSVAIRVTDRGPGIAAEDLPRIFERFWKGDASRQRDGEGSGLGLAIARHIAEAHGGSVTATSTAGAGSTFVMTLPAPGPPPAR